MPTKLPNRKKKPGVLGTTTNGSAGNFTDSAMDEFLAKRGLYRKPIAKDGSCLFRAVSEQVHNCQARHLDVRNQCIAFMRQNREQFEAFVEGPFDHHLFKLQNPKEWAGQVEITALSQMYRKDFVVYQDINSSPTKVTDHGYKDKILLCYSNGNHYDIIYHIEFQEHAAMCQSILYEILYNKVFIELDKKENARKGKQKGTNNLDNSRNSQKSIMDLVNGCMTDDTDTVENGGDDDGWTEVKSKARAKHERLAKPVEVDENKEPEENKGKTNNDQKSLWELRRSVDPHLYRNISLEVWEEDKTLRQQQDLAVAASMQYKTNDRCLVKLGPPNAPVDKNYNAVIKEDYSGGGTVLVYIHELKEKQVVPIQYVKPFENQQGHNYKDLTGYYKKEEGANGPVPEDGSKDDNKNKKKRPPRGRRGPGKGGDDSGNVSEDAPRSRGRQRYGNRRRYPNSKDDRIARDEEEARFIAEQIKLVELQEKDPKAFPALPVRAAPQVSPTVPAISPQQSADVEEKVKVPHPTPPAEEKPPEKDKAPTSIDSSPAEFWSRLKTKPVNEVPNHSNSPLTSPTAKQKENQPQQILEEILNKPPITKEGKKQEKQEPVEEEEVIEIAPEKQPFVDDIESTKPKQTAVPELEKRQYQTALQLKPLTTDVKHSKATVQVYEVKIPQPAKLMQQARVSPPSKLIQQQQQQEAKNPPQPQPLEIRDANLPSSLVESHVETVEKDFPKPAMENKMVEDDEVAGSNIKESEGNETIPRCDHGELSTEMPSSTDKPVNNEEEVSQMEENVLEEEPVKVNKTKVVDAVVGSVNPERKTVTFAEKHKEIPAIPYSQSQKGILIVNGTNRSNQTGEQGYKTPNPEDYTTASKESKQDFTSIPQEQTEKDLQALPSAIASEGLQSSSPTAQQQNQAPVQFFMPLPLLPAGVQMPSGPSHDPSGSDLPPDTLTLRYFFNLGYHQYVIASQMNNQQLPFVYTYQGAMQDQMIQPTPQPVASLSQQQLFANMQHHQLAYQHAGLQNYQAPFHMPQTSQDATSQHDRASERNNPTSQHHQGQLQPHQQIQMSHQQQSGHFQPQQQQQQSQFGPNWRTQRSHYNNSNKSHMGHHGNMTQPHRPPYHQNSVGSSRQAHFKENNKQNRKQQGMKSRNNDSYTQPHYSNLSHPPNMAHSPATSSQATFYSIPGDQSKGPGPDYYPGSAVMFNPVNYHAHMPAGMPPHSTVSSRGMFN